MEKIPIIRVIFKSMPDLVLLRSEYDKFDNILKFCKEYSISLKDIHKVKPEIMSPKDFPDTVWEG